MSNRPCARRMVRAIFILLLALFITACGTWQKQVLRSESDYLRAFNKACF
ncbi:MAG: hypothetical protein K4571_14450 [Deltaproteobacteria bacterium]